MKRAFNYKIHMQILLFLTLLMISGCEKIQPGEPYECKIGSKYWLDENLSFSIDSIRDYRCPKDVICIWAGDVDLYFNIYLNLTKIDTLTGLYRRNPFETGDYIWKVLEINPWPVSGQNVEQKDYKVKLIIQKK